jgi:tetratricopeptide (TPR) repeat protein
VSGREDDWIIVNQYRVWLALDARDWPTAVRLQQATVVWNRDRAAVALAAPADQLTADQRHQLRNLAVSIEDLGHTLREQDDPGCLAHYQEGLELFHRIQDRQAEANLVGSIGTAYVEISGLRDLDRAEYWYQRGFDLHPEGNPVGWAKSIMLLARVALERLGESRAAGEPEAVLLDHFNAALRGSHQALDLIPADDAASLAEVHNLLGVIYGLAGDTALALHHYQQAVRYHEARGSTYAAGQIRHNIAVLLAHANRVGDALLYARAALNGFERTGPGAGQAAAWSRDLIARLEQQ